MAVNNISNSLDDRVKAMVGIFFVNFDQFIIIHVNNVDKIPLWVYLPKKRASGK